jgi:hypothetical protein
LETGRDRRALAADAGFGSLSVASILAGVLVAYGAFAVLIGVAASIVDALNVDTDLAGSDYEQLGITGGLILAATLLISYLFGGYVAGRMARRAGLLNGLLVAILGLAIAAAVAALVRASDAETINTSLRSLGVPTTGDEYGQAFTVAGIASLAAILIGSLFGGALGEKWHGKLLARAVDPNVGTDAAARRRAEADMSRAEQERTLAFDRARIANPSRSRRADRDAVADADRQFLDDGDDDTATTVPLTGRGRDDDRTTGRGRVLPRRGTTGAPGAATDDVDTNTVVGNRALTGRDRQDEAIIADAEAHRHQVGDADDEGATTHRGFRRRLHRNDR